MSNTVPANALSGPIPIPAYDTFTFSTTSSTAALPVKKTSGSNLGTTHADLSTQGACTTHKIASNYTKFPTLNNVTTNQLIWAAEINSLKWAIKNVADFWNQTGNGKITSVAPNFISRKKDDPILAAEWNQIRDCLVAFASAGVQGASALESKGSNDIVSADFHNRLNQVYNNIRNTCRCNSDCSCNLVCTCNYNCGCNYSDERLKENVEKLSNADYAKIDEFVDNFNLYKYHYKHDTHTDLPYGQQFGAIAQDLIRSGIGGIAVDSDELGYYHVSYDRLVPLLIDQIKNLKIENRRLQEQSLMGAVSATQALNEVKEDINKIKKAFQNLIYDLGN